MAQLEINPRCDDDDDDDDGAIEVESFELECHSVLCDGAGEIGRWMVELKAFDVAFPDGDDGPGMALIMTTDEAVELIGQLRRALADARAGRM